MGRRWVGGGRFLLVEGSGREGLEKSTRPRPPYRPRTFSHVHGAACPCPGRIIFSGEGLKSERTKLGSLPCFSKPGRTTKAVSSLFIQSILSESPPCARDWAGELEADWGKQEAALPPRGS